ncbi:MAG: hypothetical protein IJ650_03265 [Paludibacteraceae bacterium]|nr:hypothetical protein [Paludibacteraceae bacterium]
MCKNRILLISYVIICFVNIVDADTIFIDKTYERDDIYMIPLQPQGVFSMSVNGYVKYNSIGNNNCIARVILVDTKQDEYLFDEFDSRFDKEGLFLGKRETIMLDSIQPLYLKIICKNSSIHIDYLTYEVSPDAIGGLMNWKSLLNQNATNQVNKWNKYIFDNKKHWLAEVCEDFEYSYDNIKSIFYCDDDNYVSSGIEFYAGGIFEIVPSDYELQDNSLIDGNMRENVVQFVDEFDWRSRHGSSWITSIKNQNLPSNPSSIGNGGCWVFGPVASVEAVNNLYYNQHFNVDLSEQEVGVCSHGGSISGKGGVSSIALKYIKENGVCNEECMPFQNDCTILCSEKCNNPDERIFITDYQYISCNIQELKWNIINKGPLISGYSHSYLGRTDDGRDTVKYCGHSMSMVGFHTIGEYDTITLIPSYPATICNIDSIIYPGNELIGQTYWIFKNSAGTIGRRNGGYVYAVFPHSGNTIRNMSSTYKIITPIISLKHTDDDIVVTDNDNDGYYFWGLGPKPTNCPICCPDIPDGDDSNPAVAEMNEYGVFNEYEFPYHTLTITEDTCWNTDLAQCGNIIITNNATLTLSANLTMNPAAKIIINDGAKLIVNAGNVFNSNIRVESTGTLKLLNNGTLYHHSIGSLEVEVGGQCDIEHGNVLML